MKNPWPERFQKWKGAVKDCRYALLVVALGVMLLLLPTGSKTEPEQTGGQAETADSFDLEEFEARLSELLSSVEGAGETKVLLTVDSGSRQVLAQDVERESGGGGTATTITVGRGSGTQEVVPIQTIAPHFRGAVVVCPGGGDPQVKLKLVEAVSALTGLGADRISICEGNQ
jgi:stage III sporulation protein AG